MKFKIVFFIEGFPTVSDDGEVSFPDLTFPFSNLPHLPRIGDNIDLDELIDRNSWSELQYLLADQMHISFWTVEEVWIRPSDKMYEVRLKCLEPTDLHTAEKALKNAIKILEKWHS